MFVRTFTVKTVPVEIWTYESDSALPLPLSYRVSRAIRMYAEVDQDVFLASLPLRNSSAFRFADG